MNHKLFLLGSLYLAQGLPYGFFTQALPVLLRERGLALPLIGLAQLLMLPWALKFLWAPFVDRVESRRGRRRAVIIPIQVASITILATLALAATPDAMWALCVGVLLVNVCAATQDIATDGLAVETLDIHERGLGNGLQVGAYRVGMVLGGGAILWLFGRAGWTVAFLAMAGLLALASVPIVLHREEPAPRIEAPPRQLLRDAFARPGFAAWAVVLVTYKTGEWFATAMLRTFLVDAKQSLEDIAVMVGMGGFAAGLTGAVVGGLLTTRLGRRRALVTFGILQTLAIGSMSLAVFSPSVSTFYAVTIAEHFTSGMATAALFTAMMDFSRPATAGTDYTVQASLVVIATGAAVLLSGVSAKALGYANHFLVAAALSAIGVIAVLCYRPRHRALTFL
jgi:PAT family beta-lactamase induction signal transducer AmpG